MGQATGIIQAGIAKIVALILVAGVCMLVAGAAGFILARRNPQWSLATKRVVHSACMFGAAVVFALFAVAWIRT
jgi:hypothetical protein